MPRPTLFKSGPLTATERQQRWRAKVRKRKAAEPRLAKLQAKQQRRDERERDLAERTIAAVTALGDGKRYGVLLADPPWRFEPYSRETGMDRSADNHYPTMTLDAIKALKVPAAEHCVLFLWATAPMLREALEVMAAWGFQYKTFHVWAKDRIGTGYWVRENAELLLVGTKGEPVPPAPGQQFPTLIEAPRGRHSAKPPAVAEMIEQLWPNTPRSELFAREPRPGWEVWGNEVMFK